MPKNKVRIAQFLCVFGVIPVLLFAYEFGPDPGYTGAPGDNRTACIASGCHAGTVNSLGGNVTVTAADGGTYTPGATQRLTVKITDTPQRSWGFQITARLASNLQNGQAGTLINFDTTTQVLCADGQLITAARPTCANQFPLQYAEHTLDGWSKSRGNVGTFSYQVDWRAPATDVGEVMFYVAANASNGTNQSSAGHIYTSTLKLSPKAAGGGGVKPAITSSGGVVNGATNLSANIAPNTYISIFGSNLATNSRTWTGSDFGPSGTNLPTSLDGTSVQVNGRPAYVNYISPTQINAITPSGTATGSGIPITVTTNGQTSEVATVTMNAVSPGFFTFDNRYVAAADAISGAIIGKTGLFPPPTVTTPAKPGQLITLYGTGFGPTTPAIAEGQVTGTDRIYNVIPVPTVTIGDAPANVAFAGLSPGLSQVFQFNVTVPANAPDGDLKIFAQTGGTTSPNTDTCCFITVKR